MSSQAKSSARGRRRRSAAERAANYSTIKTIGKGSYGTVDLVKRKDNHKLYVMKRVKYASSDGDHKGALKEVKFLRMLKHPNIVDFGEAFVTPDRSYLCIVMGHCEGGDLIHKIKEYRKLDRYIPEDMIMEWFVQMCMALAYLHDQRILHRDIKPHNVFLTNHGRVVKVGDFGVTRILEHTGAMAKTTIGTPYYVSPEICCNRPYNAKSDVWALGVVLYELCQLRVPFDAANFPQLRVKIVHDTPPDLAGPYSPELQALVKEMLIKDQRKRPSVRALLKRRVCQHHLRLLMQRHSKKTSSESKQSSEGAGAPTQQAASSSSAKFMSMQRKQTKLEAKLAAKQRALAKARGEDTTPRRVDVGGARLSHKQREDFLKGSQQGGKEAEVLEKEVEEVKQELVKTSVEVHKAVIANEQQQEEIAMKQNAKTIVEQTAAGTYTENDPDAGNDGGEDESKGGQATTLGSVGHELVHQLATSGLSIKAEDVSANAVLRDVESPVVNTPKPRAGARVDGVRLGHRDKTHALRSARKVARVASVDHLHGAPLRGESRPGAGDLPYVTRDSRQPRARVRRGSGYSQDDVRDASARRGSGMGRDGGPVVVPRLKLDNRRETGTYGRRVDDRYAGGGVTGERSHRSARSEGSSERRAGSLYTSGRTGSRGGTRPASKGRSRRGGDSHRSQGDTRGSRVSRPDSRSLFAHPMGVDVHELELGQVRQEQALLIERLPETRRPGSRNRPLTAGSDFSEGLNPDLVANVLQDDAVLSARSRDPRTHRSMGHSQSRPALRRRPETTVHLQPLGMR